MHFSRLCDTYEKISQTSKRLEKTAILADLLAEIPETDMEVVMLLLQGRVFPAWDRTTLGISQKLAIKAIRTATGLDEQTIVKHFKKLGDLGEVAAELTEKKQQATLVSQDLTVQDVLKTIQKLASIEGLKSVDRKLKLIAQLLGNASANESRFLIRILLEDLRIGIAEGTIRDSIIWWQLQKEGKTYNAEKNVWSDDGKTMKEWQPVVQDAIDKSNDLARVALAANVGLKELKKIELTMGTPTRVMLAQRSTDIDDAFSRVGKPAAVEYKYDGFRMQIHKSDTITLFTRRLENVTEQFPDVVQAIKKHIPKNCVLDAEIVGYDPKTKRHTAFQQISQRIRRKYDIEKLAKELPVEVNVFDILVLDDKTVYQLPFSERRKLIEQVVPVKPFVLQPSTLLLTDNDEQVEKFYAKSLDKGYEGLMFKTLDAPYKPGSRVGYMVKLKPTLDTLDLVVTQAEWGEGKRSGWLTSFTVACQDENGEIVEIGKVGTGFKELEQEDGVTFKLMTELLQDEVVKEQGKEITVRPKTVLELKFEEIQKSPSYSSGFALRFPRVVRIRSDRRASEVSTIADVLDLYEAQRGRKQ